jgi:hypothetical protein
MCPLRAIDAPYGQVSALPKVKSGQSRLRSAKKYLFPANATLVSLSGLVANSFPSQPNKRPKSRQMGKGSFVACVVNRR